MTTTGTVQSITENAGGMAVKVVTGYTLPPVVEPIIVAIDITPEWARVALRGAVGKSVTITTDAEGAVIQTTVRA